MIEERLQRVWETGKCGRRRRRRPKLRWMKTDLSKGQGRRPENGIEWQKMATDGDDSLRGRNKLRGGHHDDIVDYKRHK